MAQSLEHKDHEGARSLPPDVLGNWACERAPSPTPMADDPFPTNQAAETVNEVVSKVVDAADDLAAKSIETTVEASMPFFSLPVIRQLTDALIEDLIGLIGKDISVSLQQIGTFMVIDTQVNGEKTGVSQALANIMIAEKSGDQNAISKAIGAYQKAQSALVNSDGAAPIHS